MANAVIAIAGSSGLIGSALVYALRATDRRVLRIVRRAPSNADEVFWNPDTGEFDSSALAGVDAVVNLCGVNVGEKRWSGAFKQCLRDSRIGPTEVLSAAVVEAGVPTLINASAVGYYGDTGGRTADETAPAGEGFMAQLCEDWEAATSFAAARRHPGGAGAHRAGAGAVGRDSGPHQAAVLIRAGCPIGQRTPVHAVDQSRGRGAGAAVRDLARRVSRSRQPDRACAGDQRRVHRRARPHREPAHPVDRPGICAAHRCWASSPRKACSAGSARSRRRWSARALSSTTTPSARRWPSPQHRRTHDWVTRSG